MAAGSAHGEELNLVPYLDIVTTLMIALLAIAAYNETIHLKEAHVEVPTWGKGPPAPELIVAIDAGGFAVAGPGGAVRIPRSSGDFPYAALTASLRAAHDAGGARLPAKLTATPSTPYRVVVATLDAMRNDASGALYPAVTLAAALDAG